jgi:hypothetical protein
MIHRLFFTASNVRYFSATFSHRSFYSKRYMKAITIKAKDYIHGQIHN